MGFDVNKIIMESLQDVAEKPVVVTETVVAAPVLEDVIIDKEKIDDSELKNSEEITKSLTESEAIKSAAFAAGLGALNAIKHLRRV